MPDSRKSLVIFGVFIAAFFVVWSLRATVFMSIDDSIASASARAAYSDLLKLLLWVGPAAAFAHWVRRESPAKSLGVAVVPDARTWVVCLAVTVVYLIAVASYETIGGAKHLSARPLLALPLALLLLQHLVSPLLEEVFFRGLVMKELLAVSPVWLASVVTSLLFVGVHLPYWLSHGGFSREVGVNAVGVFLFSLVACWLRARSASIGPPTIAHVANNALSAMLLSGPT